MYILSLCLLTAGCGRTQTPPPKIEFVIEGRSRLVYDCKNFSSQVKTLDDIISLRLRSVTTMQELMKDSNRNLALITSIRSAMDTKDNLRLEQLVVNHECEKLLAAKQVSAR